MFSSKIVLVALFGLVLSTVNAQLNFGSTWPDFYKTCLRKEFGNQCTRCKCENGVSSCEQSASSCDDNRIFEYVRGRCTPYSNFLRDCNSCTCNDIGDAAYCTMEICMDSKGGRAGYLTDTCMPGYSFYNGCNECTCYGGGIGAWCEPRECTNNFFNVIITHIWKV